MDRSNNSINKADYQEIYDRELENYIPHFMDEINKLLIINKYNEICIRGDYYNYYISFDDLKNIVLAKEDNYDEYSEDKTIYRYNPTKKEYLELIIDKANNYYSDYFLVNEFYYLFIQHFHSTFLTTIYIWMYKRDYYSITFSPKSKTNQSFFWTISRSGESELLLTKKNLKGESINNLKVRKIAKIPNWFIISKDFFYVLKIQRLLTLFPKQSTDNSPLNMLREIFNQKSNKYINPYLDNRYCSEDEDFISDFISISANKKDYEIFDNQSSKKISSYVYYIKK